MAEVSAHPVSTPTTASATAPTVSVVMTVYNGARYLAETIDSVLAQTFTDFELVAVDDGSTDDTPDILARYAARDPRVRPVRIAHAGIATGANAGLAAARAELVARVDADDVSLPQRFERQVAFLREHPEVVAVGARMLEVDPYGSPLYETDHKPSHDEIDSDMLRGIGWGIPQPAIMLRKSVALRVGGYDKRYDGIEDVDLYLRMAEVGRLANLPDVLVRYRRHYRSSNFVDHEFKNNIYREIVARTYARRGVPAPANGALAQWTPEDRASTYRKWAWAALRHGNPTVARRHATATLLREPWSGQNWKLMLCALRGR